MITETSYCCDFNFKYINDTLYGGIGLSNLEVDLIDTPIFQRLRHLRQLGLINFVFPCGEHSRFVHSLGVLYIMGRITEHLYRRKDISMEDMVKLRVAALLHDIGHYPLSHLGEAVYCYQEDVAKSPKLTKGPIQDFSLLTKISSKFKKRAHHEHLGKYIIKNNEKISSILNNVGIDPEEIGLIITGEIGISNMIYSQLMHSSLDADRLDYLLRDSSQTGVRYGLVDLDYLVRLMSVSKNYKVSENSEFKVIDIIACNIKGQHVIEHYLMSRYFHYSQVINHKTSTSFEAVTKVIFYKLLEKEKFIFNSYQDILDNVNDDRFLTFTDETLYKSMHDYSLETDDSDYKFFYDIIIKRKRPKTLIEIKDIVNKNNTRPNDTRYYNLKRILNKEPQKIYDILNMSKEHIGFKEFEVSVEAIPSFLTIEGSRDKIEEGLREAIRLVDKDNNVTLLALDNKSLINKLTDLKSTSIHVFYLEPDKPKAELDTLYRNAKVELERLIQE